MGATKGPTPEEQAKWDEAHRFLQERLDWHADQKRLRQERVERRRRRLRRYSLGLLGR